MLVYRDLRETDLGELRKMKLRRADLLEVFDMFGVEKSPGEVLIEAVLLSSCVKVIEEDEFGIICVWGVQPYGPEYGIIWAVGTTRMYRNQLALIKFAKRQLKALRKQYTRLFNYISTRNTRTIQWLEWMGFHVHRDVKMTFETTQPFYLFTIEGE